MIYLGVDLGARRIGFAVADTDCPVATPLPTREIKNPAAAAPTIAEVYRAHGADLAVIGLPLSMNGRHNDKVRDAENTAQKLTELGLNVKLWDERLTTEEARRELVALGVSRKSRGAIIDALAAQKILSSFLAAAALG
jgi:putative Holliday junction resolvase